MRFGQIKKWWLEIHVPRVLKWQGIIGYDVNLALNDDEPFDGIGVFVSPTKLPRRSFRRSKEELRFGRHRRVEPNAIFLAEEVVIVPREKPHQGIV